MVAKKTVANSHYMTREKKEAFLEHEKHKGASDNMVRRFKGTFKVIFDFLPDDKCITKARLAEWRKSMEDKWQARITYKGVQYSLGCYFNIDDAVKARARAKELVMADAQGLLDFYNELSKSFPQISSRRTEAKNK